MLFYCLFLLRSARAPAIHRMPARCGTKRKGGRRRPIFSRPVAQSREKGQVRACPLSFTPPQRPILSAYASNKASHSAASRNAAVCPSKDRSPPPACHTSRTGKNEPALRRPRPLHARASRGGSPTGGTRRSNTAASADPA